VTSTAIAPAAAALPAVRSPSTTRRTKARKTEGGRYRKAGSARLPANGLAISRSAVNVPTTVGAVQDPYSPKEKVAVSINRRVDLLEWEYSHGRLSEAAYLIGRELQGAFERGTGRSASNWSQGDRVDAYSSKEMQIITGLQTASAIQTYMARVVRSIGQIGARFLRSVLCEGKTYAELAAMRGQSNEAGRSAAASRFRHLLEDLAEDWAATGARP
jgi:hypothetical protein